MIAPYWRFRPTYFYERLYPNGTFTADIMGCNWTCEHCWSKYGWRTVEAKYQLTPEETAVKLVEGMKRNGQPMSRISGGEPTMYMDHMLALIDEVLDRTKGQRMKVGGHTGRRGETMGIIIETNGSLLTFEQIKGIEDKWGEDAKRVVLSIGMKATTPEGLADLTGLAPKVAERAHQRQLDNLMFIVRNCEYLNAHVSFLDRFTDLGMYSAIQREIERARPGMGRRVVLQEFRSYGNANRYYTPKRFRKGRFPDDPGERDEEVILDKIDKNGDPRTDLPEDEIPLAVPPVLDDYEPTDDAAENLRAFQRAVEKEDLPEGWMRRPE